MAARVLHPAKSAFLSDSGRTPWTAGELVECRQQNSALRAFLSVWKKRTSSAAALRPGWPRAIRALRANVHLRNRPKGARHQENGATEGKVHYSRLRGLLLAFCAFGCSRGPCHDGFSTQVPPPPSARSSALELGRSLLGEDRFAVNDGAGCCWLASSAVREARPTMGSLCSIGPPQGPLQSCIALRSYRRNSSALPLSAHNSAPGRKNRNLWR